MDFLKLMRQIYRYDACKRRCILQNDEKISRKKIRVRSNSKWKKVYRSDNCYDLFAVGPYQTKGQIRYLSEDYYFSRLWTEECGGEIWADLSMPLTHFGNRAFKGHVGTLVAKREKLPYNE